MDLLLPFASAASEVCRQVLDDLTLPNLERLLAERQLVARDEAEATTLSPPHERALASALGWSGGDGALPFAAQAAAADGIDPGELAWGLLTPLHWQLGRDHVVVLDPSALSLHEDESRALFATLQPLLTSEGFAVAWGGADRWYLGGAGLDGLPAASLDRIVGRNVAPWIERAATALDPAQRPLAALLRRLQSEAQLVFHSHPVNEAREERGELVVNSLWLSGCGRRQASDAAARPTLIGALRKPMLAGDWVAWADAWRALDAGPLAAERGLATLTLCGERSAARFAPSGRSWRARLGRIGRRASASAILASL